MHKGIFNSRISVLYSLLQAFYWAGCVFTIVFCAAYLRNAGFNNKGIGLVIALSNGIGFIVTNAFSFGIDRSRISALNVCRYLVPVWILFDLFLIFAWPKTSVGIAYVGVFSLCLSLGPLYTKICVDLNHSGKCVDYGFCRGVGSLSYALVSLAAGIIIRNCTVTCLPYFILAFSVLQGFVLALIRYEPAGEDVDKKGFSLFSIRIRDYIWIIFVIGIALLFASENTFNSFRPNIVYNCGGFDEQLGYLSSIKAFSEIPVMMLFAVLARKIKVKNLLVFSLVFFAVKMFLISAATNMTMLYIAFVFNALSYGLYTPAVVEYIDKNVSYTDSAKIQLLCGSATTIGTVIATLFFGAMFDFYTVSTSLKYLTLLGGLGSIIAISGIILKTKYRN